MSPDPESRRKEAAFVQQPFSPSPDDSSILPDWIIQSSGWTRLRMPYRTTLMQLARLADRMEPDGTLAPIMGGKRLADVLGLSRATVWRHIERLEAAGFVVLLYRGGQMVGGEKGNHANQYGIPGTPDALKARKARRPMRRMEHMGAGVYRPVDHDPGEQLPLLADLQGAEQPSTSPQSETPHIDRTKLEAPQNEAPQNETTPRLNLTRPPVSKRDDPPSHNETPSAQNAYANAMRMHIEPSLNAVEAGDLSNLDRLLRLYAAAVRAGWVGNSDADRHRVVAAACRALRIGSTSKGGLWRSIVERGLWDTLSPEDNAKATRLLTRHLGLHDDVRAIRNALTACDAHQRRRPVLTLANMQALLPEVFRSWSADRWYAALDAYHDGKEQT